MRKIAEILEGMDEETRKVAEREINSSLRLLNCDVDWKRFYVYKEYETITERILQKLEVWYLISAATAIDSLEINSKKICIGIADFYRKDGCPLVLATPKKSSHVVLVPITKEEYKSLMKA